MACRYTSFVLESCIENSDRHSCLRSASPVLEAESLPAGKNAAGQNRSPGEHAGHHAQTQGHGPSQAELSTHRQAHGAEQKGAGHSCTTSQRRVPAGSPCSPQMPENQLMASLTGQPKISPYPFTTQLPQPAMMPFENVLIQLVDLSRGRKGTPGWMRPAIRYADLLALVVDLSVDPSPTTRRCRVSWRLCVSSLLPRAKGWTMTL